MEDERAGPARRRALALHAVTVLAAAIGIAGLFAARRTFSGTFDESNHLACGLEWWQFGTYTQWTENPPLPRLAIAALPYLAGMRLPPRETWEPKTHDWNRSWEVGLDALYAGQGFDTNLGRARLGVLPFYLLVLGAVWGLAGGRRRPGAGLLAVALTATVPALFAHAALATTDVAFAGTFLLAGLALARWFAIPSAGRAIALGAAVALAVLCKFSTLVFFPVALLATCGARGLARTSLRPRRDDEPLPWRAFAGHVGLSAAALFLVTWAGYRFSVGRIEDLAAEVKDWLTIVPGPAARGALGRVLLHVRLPMPELFHGLRFLAAHDATGHEAYLLGRVSDHGFRWFYPIALAVKTPLPLLALLLVTLPAMARPRRGQWVAPALALTAFGILLVSLRSHVNLGIRHVFVILPLLAVAVGNTAESVVAGWSGRRRAWAVAGIGLLMGAQAVSALASRRTALGYFNVLAGPEPAKVLLDSDLDWGQDLYELRRLARSHGVDRLKLAYFGMVRLCQHGLPPLEPLPPGQPARGWIAISENYYRNRSTFMLLKQPCEPTSLYRDAEVPLGSFAWLERYQPVAMAGTSIRLYHLP